VTRTAWTSIVMLSIGLSVALLCPAADAQAPGLVAYWSFDEVTGQVTPDASGHGSDATVTAAALVKGVSNAAIQFDGRTSSVQCLDGPLLGNSKAISLEAWIKLDAQPGGGFPTVVRRDGAYALRFHQRRLGFLLWFEDGLVSLHSAMSDWQPGQWYHVAGVYDGAQMRLFVDGVEDANSPQPHTGMIDPSPSSCCIGSCRGQYALKGVIDEARIYNRALSVDEVAASHQAGRDSLLAQQDVVIEPQPVGGEPAVFRKPERAITMVEDGFIWIDAEDFADYGGWLLDTQFVHLMGSAYLIAAGVGTPVDDATVDVEIPRPGEYRLWVRAKNWLQDYSPGKFQVVVGGKVAEPVFGASDTEDWIWRSAGEFDLQKGTVRIALRDLTGYYGRCDALVLTTDLDYTPPSDVEEIRQERSRLTGLSLEPELAGEWDVIVVGAGAAGSTAALASARMGARTALIQNRPVLGGNSSVELGVPINGAASGHPNARESGIIEEVGRTKARYGYPKMSEPFQIAAKDERNLSVFLNQHVFAVEMDGENRIAAVKAVDTLRNAIAVYKARMFLDCTGDGWVGYFADAERRLGREARDEFDESLAPEKPDKITMSGCLMGGLALSYRSSDTGEPAPYTAPPWAAKLPPAEEFGRSIRGFTGGQWWLEHRGEIDDIWDAEKARDELLRISFGYWDYIKNSWPERERAATYALSHVPITNAKRESRRLIGDYILTQNDVQSARVFPDRISYGGWPLDVHHPEGIYSGPEGPYDFTPPVPIYTIPFRCLYSKNIDNLLFAGRDMSVTHVALGSVRVQGTLAAIGQAAGTAAAMCVQRDVTPRGLYREHITELQQTLLKNDQYIPEVRNEDPLDLARQARVTASSATEYETFGKDQVEPEDVHPLNMPRGMMFPTGAQRKLESVSLLLASEADEPRKVRLHLRASDESGDLSSTEDLATAEGSVSPGAEDWVEFRLDEELPAPYAWVWLEPAEGISWRLMSKAPMGACRAYGGDGNWTVVKGQYYAAFTTPEIALEADFAPENAINGWARIIGDRSNMWASDPTQPMPQWIELAFEEPKQVNSVYLTFDTDMNAKFHTVPLPKECVRDYDLAYSDGGEWHSLAEVPGNFQRRRVHRFEAVTASRLRLTVHATNGHKSARVFEIRVYNE
jgi:hypothetical protein